MLLWATSQPTATHALVGLLVARALPAKINKVLISGAHPGTPINVTELRFGEDLEHQSTLNRLQQGGRAATNLPKYFPNRTAVAAYRLCSSAPAKQVKLIKTKIPFTVLNGR